MASPRATFQIERLLEAEAIADVVLIMRTKSQGPAGSGRAAVQRSRDGELQPAMLSSCLIENSS